MPTLSLAFTRHFPFGFAFSFMAVIVLCLSAMAPSFAATEKRVALVIGNNGYKKIAPLEKANNDARTMASTLERVGFETQLLLEGDRKRMNSAINRFVEQLADGGIGVLFYAGHGIQINNENYLLPIDVDPPEHERDVVDQAVSLQGVQEKLAQEKVNFALLIIDACRDNPLPKRVSGRSIGVNRGLAQPTAPNGQMVLFSAGSNQQALDKLGPSDSNPNSVFTRELAQEITQPGISVSESLRNARSRVIAAARSVGHDQHPALYDQSDGDFYLAGRPVARIQSPTQQKSADSAELTFWDSIKDSGKPQEYLAYLQAYPKGMFVALAKLRAQSSAPRSDATAGIAIAAKPDETNFRDCPDCPELIRLPAGSFSMGNLSSDTRGYSDEEPIHEVRLHRRFAMGKYELSVGEFRAFVDATGFVTDAEKNTLRKGCQVLDPARNIWIWQAGRHWRNSGISQQDNQPVTCVSWHDAQAYLQWLSRKTGHNYRLPSEAEWEYAARAQRSDPFFWGTGADQACKYANLADASAKTHFPNWNTFTCHDDHFGVSPRGSFLANDYGLFDMTGNVWEWTEDCWHDDYTGAPSDGTAWLDNSACSNRVSRGGAWPSLPRFSRISYRFSENALHRNDSQGFRVVRELKD